MAEYKDRIKKIHTEDVSNWVDETYSKLLGTRSPLIDDNEAKLDRATRRSLAQLRFGYSSLLNIYLSRIDPDVTDKCDQCWNCGHTTRHLLNFPSNPTDLKMKDLWNRAVEVAVFLGLKEAAIGELENRKQDQDEVLFNSSPKRSKTEGVSACSPHGSKSSDPDSRAERRLSPGCQGDLPHPSEFRRVGAPDGSPTFVRVQTKDLDETTRAIIAP